MPRPRLDHVRKVQIVAAAAEVISQRGYANARVTDIASAAGVSPAAILYWFDGKDGLLAEALTLREQEFHDRFTARIDHLPTASARLRLLVEAMLYEYDWGLWMELCVLALRDQRAAAQRDRMDRRWRAALRHVITSGQVNREFSPGDAAQITFVLAGLLDGLAPLLAIRATGVSASKVESTWLAEAARLLGSGFDSRALRPAAATGPSDVTFEVVDPHAATAQWAMTQYFDELDRRFVGGFEPGDASTTGAALMGAPTGAFVVAHRDGVPVACGGVQQVDESTGEIKRMWVHPDARGIGLGLAMLACLEAQVARLGYQRVVLDTNGVLTEAITMYERAGYHAIERYNANQYAMHWFAKHLEAP